MTTVLDSIAAEARDTFREGADGKPLEGEHIPGGGPAPTDAEKLAEEAREWSGVPQMLGMLLSRVMPELSEVYTPAACLEWGEAMAPFARKYGWSLGRYNVELALVMSTWGLVAPTVDALKKRRAAAQPKPAPDAPPPQPQAASDDEINPEARTHPDGSPIT